MCLLKSMTFLPQIHNFPSGLYKQLNLKFKEFFHKSKGIINIEVEQNQMKALKKENFSIIMKI